MTLEEFKKQKEDRIKELERRKNNKLDELNTAKLLDSDRRILETIVKTFGGGPVGIETIAAAISEETDTLEDVYEPYLMQLGLLQRTPRGRMATSETYRYLNLPFPFKE